MDLPKLVQAAAESLDASVEEEAAAFFLTVPVAPAEESEDDDEDDRTQMVYVHREVETDVVIVATDVGPWDEDLDLTEALRVMRNALFTRVYLQEREDDVDQLVVESCIPARLTDVEILTSVIQEVAEIADELELQLFSADDEEGDEDDEEDEEDEGI